MIHDIPVFGPPLAGKTSFLVAAASASGICGRSVESTLRTNDAFNGAPIRLLELEFQYAADSMRLWCIPGGSDPQWALQFVTQSSAALFIADTQQTRHDANAEHWRVVRDVVPIDRWFVVLTKCDLTDPSEQRQALPVELRSRPSHRVATHEQRVIASPAQGFLAQVVFPSVARGG